MSNHRLLAYAKCACGAEHDRRGTGESGAEWYARHIATTTPVPSEADPGTGEREWECRKCLALKGSECICVRATPDAGDVEALADEVFRRLDPKGYGWAAGDGPNPEGVLAAVLASDWLASHDAATTDRVRREVLDNLRLVVGMSGYRFADRSDHAEALRMIDEAREAGR